MPPASGHAESNQDQSDLRPAHTSTENSAENEDGARCAGANRPPTPSGRTAPALDTGKPVREIDGRLLHEKFDSALAWLEKHVTIINALNVFPVPDGDTGTNMLMTMKSALKQAAQRTSDRADDTAHNLAQGAMRGARGNSGVILSQILQGFARGLKGKDAYTTDDFAVALRKACDAAYGAVMQPVEGTILTVVRAVAEAAEDAARNTCDIREQMGHLTSAARSALQRTPDLLPVLKDAGVVDSGGQGLVTILEGMNRYLCGEPNGAAPVAVPAEIARAGVDLSEPPAPLADGRYGYDIQYLILGNDLDVDAIREEISRMGDCPLVVGSKEMVKVHIHAISPGPALDFGAGQGHLDDIVVENMDLQFDTFTAQQAVSATAPAPELTTESVTGVGIVAVVAGDGLAQHFQEMGASIVVRGGQGMNPSTEELLNAVDAVRADEVIILPNNKNVIMAAEQVGQMAGRPVHIVPTRSAPQGFAALMSFDYSAGARENAETMAAAVGEVVTVEVTTAVRTASVNNVNVQKGQQIGLLDGELAAAGQNDAAVVREILNKLDLDKYSVGVVYYGADRSAGDAETLAAELQEQYPDLDFEVHAGGQPHYSYIISIE